MKEIKIKTSTGVEVISAGAERYSELSGYKPIDTSYIDTAITLDENDENDELVVTTVPGHRWTEEELLWFCQRASDGRYDINSAKQGHEIILIDSSNAELGKRYRRINVDYDEIWDSETDQWLTISDTTAKQLIVKFLNEDEIPSALVVGDPLVVKLYYYSNIGTGRITITMNDSVFSAGTVRSGDTVEIDLSSRVKDGANTISIKIANDATEKFIPAMVINGINLTYTPNFNQYQPFMDAVTFAYACAGSADKIVHFDIVNSHGEVSSIDTDRYGPGYTSAFIVLPSTCFSKGENYIYTYMYALNGSTEIARTITTTYKIPYLTDDEPLLMVYFEDWNDLKQYGSISIPYYVWKNTVGSLDSISFSITSDAFQTVEYNYDTGDAGAVTNYLQYNYQHNWLISSLPSTFVDDLDKKATFRIVGEEAGVTTNEFIKTDVTIASSSSALETVGGYVFNFAAKDLLTATDTWVSRGTDPKTMLLEGFNWNTDGIKFDKDGTQVLHYGPAASSTMSEATNPLFDSYNKPFTLEIDFKVSESAVEAPIIKYYDPSAINPDPYGLFIYPNKAIFKYQGGTSEVNYMKGERTALTYTICNKTVSDKDPNTGQTKTENLLFLFVYINGILSQMKPINTTTSFPSGCGTIVFNCNNNDFDLYSFRGYRSSLSSAQVLQNFISNIGKASLKEQLYLNNAIYSETKSTGVQGEYAIDFDKVKGKIPCYVVVADSLPDTKDYLDCRGIYYEAEGYDRLTEWKNNLSLATTYYYTRETSTSPWIRSKKIKFSGQGTSSLAYPRKNFKFKHNDKFYIKGHETGREKTFTFKADYMDSSGANNIGSAQILDDAIIRENWIGTPVASNPDLRVNLDGFPIAMFWCKSTGGKGGVVQSETATDVFDTDGLTRLYDEVKQNSEYALVGEVTPLNPVYIGTFNFNYDKKAKSLLGWDEDVFQGFEFRGNSSKANLFRGFENMCAMASTSEGFEWRWTFCSDYIDDYHDGNLRLTIDGGYFDEDVARKYSEADYLANPEDIIDLVPYNQFYVIKDGIKCQIFHKVTPEEGEVYYEPINYGSIDERNLGWSLVECEGISKPSSGICLEYGIKTAIKDGVESLVYQLPYGVSAAKPLGEAYSDGSHYYKFSWNPEHEFKFEYNNTQDYFTDIENWTTLYPLNEVFYLKTTYNQNDNGDYYFDDEEDGLGVKDGKYHLINNYPVELQNALLEDLERRYDKTEEYINLKIEDEVKTFDFMREVFKNWCYVIEAVAHCDNDNWKSIFDSTLQWSDNDNNNGNGIFVYDSLTNYYCSSLFTGLCDNFAKNMFMHSYDGGRTWSPAWYDMDTAFGLNNEGAYTKMYDIDFLDRDNTGALAFNGSNSRIWQLLYNNAMSDLKSMYQILRARNYISYDNIIKRTVEDNISYKAASLYNANAVYRYMEPLAWHSNTKPEAAQGSREQLMKYWNYNRQTFMDSRYEGSGWTTDTVVLRLNNSDTVTFELVPDTNMFLGANFNSGQATVPSIKSTTKVQAGARWSCSYDRSSTNLNTYIYGASHLLQLGDLSLCNSTEYSLSNATNLTTIKIGDDIHPPIVITRLNLSNNIPYKNLRTLDLTKTNLKDTNLSLVVGEDRHNLTPALETLKLAGSNIEYLTLAPFTPIVNLSLPSSIKKIELVNLLNLENLAIEGYDNLENVEITNCPEVNQLAVLNGLYNSPNIDTIKLDNLRGEYEQAVTQDFMDRFLNLDSQGSQKVILSGTIYVQALDVAELDKYGNRWPNLNVKLHRIYANDVILGVENEGFSTVLERTYGAKNKQANFADNPNDPVTNEFDMLEPYKSMSIVTDEYGNKFLRIPKFYSSYVTDSNGYITERKISKYKVDNTYKYNPEFLRADGSEREYVDIGIYMSSTNIDSVAGVTPADKTKNAWSSDIQNKYGDNNDFIYSMESIWTRQLLQDLFTIEFANTSTQSIFRGSSATEINGITDILTNYVTGYNKGTLSENPPVSFKYRGMENIWATGGPVHIQGIKFVDGWALVSTAPEYYDTIYEEWERTNLKLPNSNGVVSRVGLDSSSPFLADKGIQLTLQTAISSFGTYTDLMYGPLSSSTRYAVVGATENDSYGLWFLGGDFPENGVAKMRLVRRPK